MLQKTHSLAGLLAAESVVLYFNEPLISWESAALLMIGCLAGPLADIDKPGSTIARIFFPVSALLRFLKIRHRTLTHSLICILGLYFLLLPLPQTYLWASLLAYASHTLLDLFNEQGVALLWPLRMKFRLIPKFLAVKTGSVTERLIQIFLLVSIVLLPIIIR
ncbi:metal-dependent hydrolase [Paenibacillus albiflavus]|uniref:Metal-dependent hydrolase n=1 Tax=Paenibacillus albiflavus TaxID=2545760 RepID=A0A4R4E8E2_9BACL|nr:metal-dependent hydrolase [Paenibacillus albiflavus]TCZ75819.1 metal-dependent hydrolase [Paenibacillus albiflavus]